MLVVQASIMGRGGEVFILRMGLPIKIIELAKDLIALHGLRAEEDVKIELTGLREGEKLNEDLVVDGEEVQKSPHDHILVAHPRLPNGWDSDRALAHLRGLAARSDGDGIRKYLGSIIPDAGLS